MLIRSLRLAGVALAVAAAASPAVAQANAPASVTVRVEGLNETLLPATQVTTTTAPVVNDRNPEHACSGTSGLGALQDATGGNWSGPWYGPSSEYEIFSILGETHTFETPYYWDFWLNDKESTQGACRAQLQPGDRVLFFVGCFGESCPTPPPLPLEIESPPTVNVGEPVTVTVRRYSPEGVASEVAGATVTGAGTSATTDAHGRATLVPSQLGPSTLRVSAAASIRTEAPICVHNGNDGTCGTSLPGTASTSGGGPALTPVSAEPDGARTAGVIAGHTYRHGRSPRILAGSVTVPAGKALREVRIGIERRVGRRCWTFSGVRASFVRTRCGARPRLFSVGNEASFSYLLPQRLPRGSYVYEVEAIDGSGHGSALLDGVSRVRFRVV